MKQKTGLYINCAFCKKEIYRMKSLIKKFNYCSYSCSGKHKRSQGVGGKTKSGIYKTCVSCDKKIYCTKCKINLRKHDQFFCSTDCKTFAMKNQITTWSFKKTKKIIVSNPYVRKQIKGKRMKEHRRIMEEYLGRKLEKHEIIHHINENPKDNRIENLMITNASDHGKIHKPKK